MELDFAIGWLSFVVPVMLTLAYLAGYQARRWAAWSKRQQGPTDRVSFFVVMAIALGFVLGSLLQPMWNKGAACKAAGQALAPCVLLSK